MPKTRLTETRKRFARFISQHSYITMSDIKKQLAGKGDGRMDMATIYRTIDVFKKQWFLHEMEIAGERVIIPCKCENATPHDAVTISFCENCGMIFDVHTPLASPYTSSITYNHMKNCSACIVQ